MTTFDLKPALHLDLTPDIRYYAGEANGQATCLILADPDTAVYVRPVVDAVCVGVELVDQRGKVLVSSVRCRPGYGAQAEARWTDGTEGEWHTANCSCDMCEPLCKCCDW